jgi:hypothetical protein
VKTVKLPSKRIEGQFDGTTKTVQVIWFMPNRSASILCKLRKSKVNVQASDVASSLLSRLFKVGQFEYLHTSAVAL